MAKQDGNISYLQMAMLRFPTYHYCKVLSQDYTSFTLTIFEEKTIYNMFCYKDPRFHHQSWIYWSPDAKPDCLFKVHVQLSYFVYRPFMSYNHLWPCELDLFQKRKAMLVIFNYWCWGMPMLLPFGTRIGSRYGIKKKLWE